jgi:hypothetical protein
MPQTATILTRALQTESLSADTDRLVQDILFDEGGVVDKAGDSFQVTQDTGANMQVTVGSGAAGDKAVIERDGRVYILEHQDASIDLAISAADADDDRIDLVVVRVYDDEADNSGNTYGDIEVWSKGHRPRLRVCLHGALTCGPRSDDGGVEGGHDSGDSLLHPDPRGVDLESDARHRIGRLRPVSGGGRLVSWVGPLPVRQLRGKRRLRRLPVHTARQSLTSPSPSRLAGLAPCDRHPYFGQARPEIDQVG